MYKMF